MYVLKKLKTYPLNYYKKHKLLKKQTFKNKFSTSCASTPVLNMFPNPAISGKTTITLHPPLSGPCNNNFGTSTIFGKGTVVQQNTVNIYNFYGNKVYETTFTGDTFTTTDANLAPGNYVINITTSQGETLSDILVIPF